MPTFRRHSAIVRGPSREASWQNQRAASPVFLLELSRGAVVGMRPSGIAQLVYFVLAMIGAAGGLVVEILLVNGLHLAAQNSSIVVGLGLVSLIPGGMAVGAVGGRSILKFRPKTPGVAVRVSGADLGAFIQTLDLVSPRGALTVRVIARRKRLEDALRLAQQMPPADHVFRSGPFA